MVQNHLKRIRSAYCRWPGITLRATARAGYVVALLVFSAPFGAHAGHAVEIWFNGVAPLYARPTDPSVGADFKDLFHPEAPWAAAAAKIRVFKISSDLASRGPDDLLSALIADLKRRRIALALEGLMLTANLAPGGCGRGIEGYTGPDHMVRIAERIKRLGGQLDYVAMDEPLWYGHHFAGPNACRASMAALAQEIALRIAAMRRVFPALRFGDIEPVGAPRPADWVDKVMQWTAAYETATGERMAFFHADVQWHGPWRDALADLAARLRSAGVKFGVIYNGNVSDPPEQWIRRAEERFVAVESQAGWIPDQAIFQIWGSPRRPRNLPDSQPGTFTNLVNRYTATPSFLTLARENSRLTGKLTASDGQPIENADVTLVARDRGPSRIMGAQHLAGRVPDKAARAIIGLRINTECNCSGPADLALGPMRFREEGGMDIRPLWPVEVPGGEYTIQAQPGQPIASNTQPFSVTPGSQFSLDVPMRATPASRAAGYVALVFQDKDGKEIRRQKLSLEPGATAFGGARTDSAGRFSVPLPVSGDPDAVDFNARFEGNRGYRPSTSQAP